MEGQWPMIKLNSGVWVNGKNIDYITTDNVVGVGGRVFSITADDLDKLIGIMNNQFAHVNWEPTEKQ